MCEGSSQLLVMFDSVPGGRRTWEGDDMTEKTWPGLRTTVAGPPYPTYCDGWMTVRGLMDMGDFEPWGEADVRRREEEEDWARVWVTLTGATFEN